MSELTHDDQVSILAGDTPPVLQAWRAEDTPRNLYKTTGYESVIADDAFAGSTASSEARASAVSNLREAMRDTGIPPAEMNSLFTRSAIVRDENRSVDQQRAEARKQFARTFGEENVDQALADANKLINRDPRFARWLNAKGLGNDAPTLLMMAKAARSQRIAGRLK